MNEDNSTNLGKIETNNIERFVPHSTPSFSQQAAFSKQILSKLPTELLYVEGSVFMNEVTTRNFWTFQLGTREFINVLVWKIVGFQQRDRQDSQNLKNDTI